MTRSIKSSATQAPRAVAQHEMCFSTEFMSAAERPTRWPRKASQQTGAPTAPTRSLLVATNLQVALFDKKPRNLAQTLNFLSQNRAERPKFLRSKIEKIFRERGCSGGRQPPRGVIHPSLSKLQDFLLRNGPFGG